MRRCRPAILLLFIAVLAALVFFGSQLQVRTAFAFPGGAGSFNPAAPTANTCAAAGCHTGTTSAVAPVITFPSGLTYKPGTTQHLTLTVNGTTYGTWGFQLTSRLASNLSSQAGTFTPVTNSNPGPDPAAVQGSASSPTFTFDWTPPSTTPPGGNVNFYLTGLNTGSFGSNVFSTAMYTLVPAVTPPAADFSLSASNLTITQGASGSSTITISPKNNFAGSVALSASGLPTGVTSSFSPASATTTSALTLTASSAATAATSTITVTGTSGSLSHTATLSLTVNAATVQKPDFSLMASPSSLTITQGSSGSSTITVTPMNSFSGSVVLSASSLPSGVTATFNPSSTTGTSTMTLNASSTAAAGTSTATINGISGSLTHTGVLILTVNAAGVKKPDFSLSASPSSLTVKQGFNGSSTITITPSNGFSGNVNLSVPGLPSGVTASFNPTTTMGTSTLTLSASTTAAAMTVALTINGTSGTLTHTTSVTLTVNAASGTGSLTASPTALTFNYKGGGFMPSSQGLKITATGAPISYSASSSGGPWLSTNPNGGNTPGTIMVSVNPANMSTGTYSGMIHVSGTGTKSSTVPVTLIVTTNNRGCDEDCGGEGTASSMYAEPYVNDPSSSGTLTALWVDLMGMPKGNQSNGDPGLVLSKNSTSSAKSQTGAFIRNVQGSLTELGFDYREGGQCSATSPRFVVVTADSVTHVAGGCSKGTITAAPMMGWRRVRFNLTDSAQTSPIILAGDSVSSITLVQDQGPETGSTAAGGLVVIDNIDINGTIVGKGAPVSRHRQSD